MGKGKDFRDRVLKAAVASATPAAIGVVTVVGLSATAKSTKAALVINEVYGGGGTTNTTVTYQQDFIELYNNGATPLSLTGDIVEYGSATGAFPATSATSNVVSLLSGSLAPGGYFLIAGATQGTLPGAALPTPDETSSLNLAATAGKVELLLSDGSVGDLIGYGSTASTREGTNGTASNAPAPSITSSDNRTAGIDTDNNNLDFTIAAPTPTSGGFTAAVGTPEPTSLGLLGAASMLVIGRRRRSE